MGAALGTLAERRKEDHREDTHSKPRAARRGRADRGAGGRADRWRAADAGTTPGAAAVDVGALDTTAARRRAVHDRSAKRLAERSADGPADGAAAVGVTVDGSGEPGHDAGAAAGAAADPADRATAHLAARRPAALAVDRRSALGTAAPLTLSPRPATR
jgi:hypothetical protein